MCVVLFPISGVVLSASLELVAIILHFLFVRNSTQFNQSRILLIIIYSIVFSFRFFFGIEFPVWLWRLISINDEPDTYATAILFISYFFGQKFCGGRIENEPMCVRVMCLFYNSSISTNTHTLKYTRTLFLSLSILLFRSRNRRNSSRLCAEATTTNSHLRETATIPTGYLYPINSWWWAVAVKWFCLKLHICSSVDSRTMSMINKQMTVLFYTMCPLFRYTKNNFNQSLRWSSTCCFERQLLSNLWVTINLI